MRIRKADLQSLDASSERCRVQAVCVIVDIASQLGLPNKGPGNLGNCTPVGTRLGVLSNRQHQSPAAVILNVPSGTPMQHQQSSNHEQEAHTHTMQYMPPSSHTRSALSPPPINLARRHTSADIRNVDGWQNFSSFSKPPPFYAQLAQQAQGQRMQLAIQQQSNTHAKAQQMALQGQPGGMWNGPNPPQINSAMGRPPQINSAMGSPLQINSTIGSPYSFHGHTVPASEWTPCSLGLNPSIVGYDHFGESNEYSFDEPGMEDFTLEFNPAGLHDERVEPHSEYGEGKVVSSGQPMTLPNSRVTAGPVLTSSSTQPIMNGSPNPSGLQPAPPSVSHILQSPATMQSNNQPPYCSSQASIRRQSPPRRLWCPSLARPGSHKRERNSNSSCSRSPRRHRTRLRSISSHCRSRSPPRRRGGSRDSPGRNGGRRRRSPSYSSYSSYDDSDGHQGGTVETVETDPSDREKRNIGTREGSLRKMELENAPRKRKKVSMSSPAHPTYTPQTSSRPSQKSQSSVWPEYHPKSTRSGDIVCLDQYYSGDPFKKVWWRAYYFLHASQPAIFQSLSSELEQQYGTFPSVISDHDLSMQVKYLVESLGAESNYGMFGLTLLIEYRDNIVKVARTISSHLGLEISVIAWACMGVCLSVSTHELFQWFISDGNTHIRRIRCMTNCSRPR